MKENIEREREREARVRVRGLCSLLQFPFLSLVFVSGIFWFSLSSAEERENFLSLFSLSLFSLDLEREKQREKKEKGIRVFFLGKDECDASSQEHCFWSILCF